MWFVQEGGLLLIQTDAGSGKVKRIRRNPSVAVAVCSASGRLKGERAAARAWLLPSDQNANVQRLLTRKYRFDSLIIKPLRQAQIVLRRRPRSTPVAIAIRPL